MDQQQQILKNRNVPLIVAFQKLPILTGPHLIASWSPLFLAASSRLRSRCFSVGHSSMPNFLKGSCLNRWVMTFYLCFTASNSGSKSEPGFNRLLEPWSCLTQRDLARKLLQDEAIVNLKFAHSFHPRKQVQVLADRPVLRQQISAAVLTLEGPGWTLLSCIKIYSLLVVSTGSCLYPSGWWCQPPWYSKRMELTTCPCRHCRACVAS